MGIFMSGITTPKYIFSVGLIIKIDVITISRHIFLILLVYSFRVQRMISNLVRFNPILLAKCFCTNGLKETKVVYQGLQENVALSQSNKSCWTITVSDIWTVL